MESTCAARCSGKLRFVRDCWRAPGEDGAPEVTRTRVAPAVVRKPLYEAAPEGQASFTPPEPGAAQSTALRGDPMPAVSSRGRGSGIRRHADELSIRALIEGEAVSSPAATAARFTATPERAALVYACAPTVEVSLAQSSFQVEPLLALLCRAKAKGGRIVDYNFQLLGTI